MASRREDEWVWGWDSTPGIVSVWAGVDGRATVWRRIADTGKLVREETRFRPWLVLDRLDDLQHLGERLGPDGCERASIRYREPQSGVAALSGFRRIVVGHSRCRSCGTIADCKVGEPPG
jgi:hypothetical protein